MKFKRILAVILSALMLTSMASFTVSAEDAELMAEPVLSFITVSNQGKLAHAELRLTTMLKMTSYTQDRYQISKLQKVQTTNCMQICMVCLLPLHLLHKLCMRYGICAPTSLQTIHT